MKSTQSALFVALALFVASSANATEYTLQNDDFVSGDMVGFQAGFAAGETGASKFVLPGGVTAAKLVKAQLLFGGATSTVDATVIVWDDPNTCPTGMSCNPGAQLDTQDVQMTGSNSAMQEVTLTPVVVTGPFRVGILFTITGVPCIARDTRGMNYPDRNFIEANPPYDGWWKSNLLGLTGDWIIRVVIDDNLGIPPDAGTMPPDAAAPGQDAAGVIPPDAAAPGQDAAAPGQDAAATGIDAAAPIPDDASTAGLDAAAPGQDAAATGLDAAEPGLDAAATGIDAAAPAPDDASTTAGLDAAAPGADGSSVSYDAGSSGNRCSGNPDCPVGQYCGANYHCTFDCRTDKDCAAQESCNGLGKCIADASAPGCGCATAGQATALLVALFGLGIAWRSRRGRREA
jgi:MYXO-CTERM domain-containing protein